ncbi:twin-arginine translocase subunit TatC [Natronomonas sp. EA1]|uniref:twin-arginine translocase subunit TatC n=1 Tax=Natronomonas sp. EA1 TaxID=3421655 RepID=UPI003EBB7B7B
MADESGDGRDDEESPDSEPARSTRQFDPDTVADAEAETADEAEEKTADEGEENADDPIATATDDGSSYTPADSAPESDEAFYDAANPTGDTESEADGGYAGEDDPYSIYDGHEIEEPTYDDLTDEDAEEGAPDDQEMPLADHIEEMVRRLGVVVVVMAIVSGIVFPFGDDLINYLWFSYLPGSIAECPGAATTIQNIDQGGAACARVYHPLALILARLKVASLAGFIVALPVFVYETYLFMRPGLYPTERRYYLASVPTSLFLALVGVLFSHFIVLPTIFTYFVFYSADAAAIAFGLTETFDLIVLMLGGFAIVFQIPLFVMLAIMMGLTTRVWLTDRRIYFWSAFAGLAFLFSPDPTGMAPIIVAATMIALFEGTLLLLKWTGR